MLYNLIAWCVFGLVAGGLARLLMPGRDRLGLLVTMLLGIGGSVVGGLIVWLLRGPTKHIEPTGLIGAVIGGMILLFLYRRLSQG